MNFVDETDAKLFALRCCAAKKLTKGKTYISQINLNLTEQIRQSKAQISELIDIDQSEYLKKTNCLADDLMNDAYAALGSAPNPFMANASFLYNCAESVSPTCSPASVVCSPAAPTAGTDAVQLRVLDLFTAHLQLVVNQRDELAMAKALLTDLHSAFHSVRLAAEHGGMSLCQTAISFVMRHRLNTHDKDSALTDHLPVLTRFVNCMDSLHQCIEDVPDVKMCVTQLVCQVAKRLQTALPSIKYQRAIDHCSRQLLEHAEVVRVNLEMFDSGQTETRSTCSTGPGSSMAGQQCQRVLECLSDRVSCWLQHQMSAGTTGVLDQSIGASPQLGMGTPQAPVRLSSITAMFHTPLPVVKEQSSPTVSESVQAQATPTEPERKMAAFVNDTTPSTLNATPDNLLAHPGLRLSLLDSTKLDGVGDSGDRPALRQVTNLTTPGTKQKVISKRRLLDVDDTQPINSAQNTNSQSVDGPVAKKRAVVNKKTKKNKEAKPKVTKPTKAKGKALPTGQTTLMRFMR